MKQSIVVEIAGSFIGVAIDDAGAGFGFVAVDERLRDLAGRRWPTLGSLRFAARRAMRSQPAQRRCRHDGRVADGASEPRQPSSDTGA
ncbi:hypothetical protein [Roseomonas sp. HF4]|uniref:hypothetical protein n=1 Tax=Roseomonas sp. HF4 TaxID=2562313 RepID=UPI0010C0F21E|nr:hypothetical protein [Roseomonas sp. HF4]